MHVIDIQQVSETGDDRETTLLLAEPRRKLTQITLRKGTVLPKHAAPDPVIIECVAGSGVLTVDGQDIALMPGRRVALSASEPHAVAALPFLSIVLTRFTG